MLRTKKQRIGFLIIIVSSVLMMFVPASDTVEVQIIALFFSFIALAGELVGAYLIISGAMKGKTGDKTLLTSGARIDAEIVEIKTNWNVKYMGRPARIIRCRWQHPEDGRYYHFLSQNIWHDPTSVLKDLNIRTVPVYVNTADISKYYVDIEEINRMIQQWQQQNVTL